MKDERTWTELVGTWYRTAGVCKWIRSTSLYGYTTPDSAVSYLNHVQMA